MLDVVPKKVTGRGGKGREMRGLGEGAARSMGGSCDNEG